MQQFEIWMSIKLQLLTQLKMEFTKVDSSQSQQTNQRKENLHFEQIIDRRLIKYKIAILGLTIVCILISCIAFSTFFKQNAQKTQKINSLNSQLEIVKNVAYATKTMLRKKQYLTPELSAISENHYQKSGIIKIEKGDVSEIDLLYKNQNNQEISQILYNHKERVTRSSFHQKRIDFIDQKRDVESLNLAKYTLKLNNSQDMQLQQQRKQYERVNLIHKLDQINTELPMCIVVSGFNNEADFRIQYNLNSIFTQNYTNYFVVITNDASYDRSDEIYRKYLHFYNVSKSKYVYIENEHRQTALQNHYNALTNYCSEDSIALIVDGDDQILGKNTLKIFNAAHQRLNGGVIYSNYYNYSHTYKVVQFGSSRNFTKDEKLARNFRQIDPKYSHLKSFKTSLFRKIDIANFLDEKNQFYKIDCDVAMFMPLMQLSCGRVYFIPGFHYLYNGMTGINDGYIYFELMGKVNLQIRRKKMLNCDEQYQKIQLFE